MTANLIGPGGAVAVKGAKEGDVNDLVTLRVDDQGRLYLAGSITLGAEVEVKNDAGNPVPVTVDNPTADPETGLAKEATLGLLKTLFGARVPSERGTPGYDTVEGGGTITVPAGGQVQGIVAWAEGVDGRFTVNGGAGIMVRADSGREWNPKGNYGPGTVVVFDASLDGLVEWTT